MPPSIGQSAHSPRLSPVLTVVMGASVLLFAGVLNLNRVRSADQSVADARARFEQTAVAAQQILTIASDRRIAGRASGRTRTFAMVFRFSTRPGCRRDVNSNCLEAGESASTPVRRLSARDLRGPRVRRAAAYEPNRSLESTRIMAVAGYELAIGFAGDGTLEPPGQRSDVQCDDRVREPL